MISSKIGHGFDPVILKVYSFFFKKHIVHPNVLTVVGALFGFLSFMAIALGYLIIGGIFLLASGFFDLVDGAIARNMDRQTLFGGFLDSVLDRYTDLFLMYGIFVYFIRNGDILNSAIAFVASIGIAIIPYAKARAEAATLECNVGLFERSERIIVLSIGLLFNLLPYAVIVLAVFAHITVLQRIIHIRKNSNG